MSGHDSESSDDDWVITSTAINLAPAAPPLPSSAKQQQPPPPLPPPAPSAATPSPTKRTQRPTVSPATVRTIRASLSKNLQPADELKTRSAAEINYISQEQLETICLSMDSQQLVRRLIETYKNAETFLRIKDIETAKMAIDARLSDTLHLCPDPGVFILEFIRSLDSYFSERCARDLTPKFRRYLVQAACQAYQTFLDMPPNERKVSSIHNSKITTNEQREETDLISFDDDEDDDEQRNLISFDDDDDDEPQPSSKSNLILKITELPTSTDEEDNSTSDGDATDDESDEATTGITMVEPTAGRYSLKRTHQEGCIRLLDTISSPVLIYYAMGVFQLQSLLGLGGDLEADGVRLCQKLMENKHYNEAISCIRKLELFHAFPVEEMAAKMISSGMSNILPVYVSGREPLQRRLLDYVNKQLRYTFAGSLGILPPEFLEGIENDLEQVPPLPRLKERRFQKALTGCCGKVLQELNEEPTTYYFIWLSQRYACLRWIIMERAAQQVSEKDYGVASSSNYNGLVDLVTADDPALAKLAIKEFVDIGDPVAPSYFASRLQQQQFFVQYFDRPLTERAVGMFKGEQLSQPQPIPSRHAATTALPFYQLPPHAKPVMVDGRQDLLYMKATLAKTRMCGLDTEWVPQFARQDKMRTALIQIATDTGLVFLVDVATLLQPTNVVLLQDLDLILRMLFEAERTVKLAYDFGGDFSLLAQCMPSAKEWQTKHLLDFKNLRTAQDHPISGGLSGVVQHFLGFSISKKQQLSNWEQRPLTVDQATYAASDAFCLLQVYEKLVATNHPCLKSMPWIATTNSPTPSPPTGHALAHSEQDLVQF